MSLGKAEFKKYAENRLQTPIDGFECIKLPHLTRYVPTIAGMEGFIVFTNLPKGGELLMAI